MEALRNLILLPVLCAAAFHDYTSRRIPDRLLLTALLAGSILNGFSGQENSCFLALFFLFLIRFAVCLLCFYPFFRIAGAGGGDWKLCSLLFCWLDPEKAFSSLALSLILSLFYCIFFRRSHFPFAVLLLPGALPFLFSKV